MDDVLAAARRIYAERHPGANVVLAAGSLVRGDGTAYSDLDLVVVYASLPAAYRESFQFGPYPVEAFVHDPETLEFFFTQVDRPSGIPALPHMVVEGVELPAPTSLSRQLKARAADLLALGPPPLTDEEERGMRYAVTDVLDDLRGARTFAEAAAAGAQLFETSANYYFRSRGHWSARGKAIPAQLTRCDAGLAQLYLEAFEHLFRTGEPRRAIAVIDRILEGHGGGLFEGFRLDAPADSRVRRDRGPAHTHDR
jgi:hypothetical protein